MSALGDPLLSQILDFFTRLDWPPGSRRLGVAVSGGVDSTVLLHALHRLSEPLGLDLLVIHINHQLRGNESDEDERCVRNLAESLKLEIRVLQAPVASADGNLEQAARQARRSAFKSLLDQGAVARIALGHTSDDQAETVLFRFLRGSGATGLCGMRQVTSDALIRPLLDSTRAEVRAWAEAQGLAWREDSSNQDLRFRRNLLRNELIPRIREAVNPGIDSVLVSTAKVAQAEEEYWDGFIQEHFQRFARACAHGYLCSVSYIRTQPLAVQRRLLRRAFEKVKGDLRNLDSAHVDAVLKICGSFEGHDRVMIPGIDALRSFDTLRLSTPGAETREKRHYRLNVMPGVKVQLPYRAGILLVNEIHLPAVNPRNCDKFVNEKDRIEIVTLNGKVLGGERNLLQLSIRNWEPGDSYQPEGRGSPKKIKELFQENRVHLWDRRHWPVLEVNGEIVWVRGFGAASKFAGKRGDASAVSLTYVPPCESNDPASTS